MPGFPFKIYLTQTRTFIAEVEKQSSDFLNKNEIHQFLTFADCVPLPGVEFFTFSKGILLKYKLLVDRLFNNSKELAVSSTRPNSTDPVQFSLAS